MNPQDVTPYGGTPQPVSPNPAPAQPAYAPAPTVAPQATTPAQYAPIAPLQPVPESASTGHNPYEFILNNQAPKRSLFGGNSMLQRVLVIVGGLVVLAIVAAIAVSLFTPKNNAVSSFTSLVEEQQEIIRLTTDMNQYATSSDLKNAAATTNLAVASDQKQFVNYLSTNKVKLSSKQLALKLDASNTKLLADAKATSTYDSTASKLLNTLLGTYQTDLKTARSTIHGTKSGPLLDKAIAANSLLITQAAAVGK